MLKNPLSSLIQQEDLKTPDDYLLKLRDILQKICLLGLWRGGFFEYSAFYGGTALRMMYDLNRFSEDLDFSLLQVNESFSLGEFLANVNREIGAWGITAKIDFSMKSNSNIESAFIKTNTLKALLEFDIPKSKLSTLHRDEICAVKFELDTNPPCPFDYEFKYILEPLPFSVCTMSLPDLFAGKMHAVLARSLQSRVKGRDWFDLIWFLRKKVPLNLPHLNARLIQSGHMTSNQTINQTKFKTIYKERVQVIDFDIAKQDVLPFIADASQLQNWSKDMFISLLESFSYIE